MKKLLVYAHYYYPDVASTGQILTELCESLVDTYDVTVICTVPSYTGKISSKYKKEKYYFEEINGVHVVRVSVPEFDKKNKISRIKNIYAYYKNAIKITKKLGKFDLVYALSQPPILGGMLGRKGKIITGGKLIYNIQDFNPEQMSAVKFNKSKILTNTLMSIDKKTCKNSDLIITVGNDMKETLNNRFKDESVPNNVVINNWIDEKEIYPLKKDNKKIKDFKKKYKLDNKFIIMYSGNLGLYYDLENIIKLYNDYKDRDDIAFVFVGDGSIKQKLIEYKKDNKLNNVVFIPYQDKKDLNTSLNAADVHLVTNAKGIKGVSVPSKIYGCLATNIPVFGILEKNSEAANIIEKSKCGIVSETGNYEDIKKNLDMIIKNKDKFVKKYSTGRKYLEDNYTKDKSIDKYKKEIEKVEKKEKNETNNNFMLFISVLLIFLSGIFNNYVLIIETLLLLFQYKKLKCSKSFIIIITLLFIHGIINVFLGNNEIILLAKQIIGISIGFLYYFNSINNKKNVSKFFNIYIKLSIVIGTLCIIQQLAYILNISFIYDLRWLVPRQLAPSVNHYRAAAIFNEPSEVALILLPAVFLSIYYVIGKRKNKLKNMTTILPSIIIIAGYILTFSSLAYVGIILCLLYICFEYAKKIKGILVLILLLSSTLSLYFLVPDFKMRVDDSIKIINNDENLKIANLSTQTLLLNQKISFDNFRFTYGFGSGIGSHRVAYNKFIILHNVVGVQMLLNKDDANSLLLRIISELGVLGLIIVCYIFARYYDTDNNSVYSIFSKVCIVYFVLRLIRYGHYFNDGMFAFVVIYMQSSTNKFKKIGRNCNDEK